MQHEKKNLRDSGTDINCLHVCAHAQQLTEARNVSLLRRVQQRPGQRTKRFQRQRDRAGSSLNWRPPLSRISALLLLFLLLSHLQRSDPMQKGACASAARELHKNSIGTLSSSSNSKRQLPASFHDHRFRDDSVFEYNLSFIILRPHAHVHDPATSLTSQPPNCSYPGSIVRSGFTAHTTTAQNF